MQVEADHMQAEKGKKDYAFWCQFNEKPIIHRAAQVKQAALKGMVVYLMRIWWKLSSKTWLLRTASLRPPYRLWSSPEEWMRARK